MNRDAIEPWSPEVACGHEGPALLAGDDMVPVMFTRDADQAGAYCDMLQEAHIPAITGDANGLPQRGIPILVPAEMMESASNFLVALESSAPNDWTDDEGKEEDGGDPFVEDDDDDDEDDDVFDDDDLDADDDIDDDDDDDLDD